MKQEIILTLMFILSVLIVNLASATQIHGNVYSPDLEIQKNAIVMVNSTPAQNMVAASGYYSFELPAGEYKIEAFGSSQGSLLYTSEIINISIEGNYVRDMILFETPDLEETDLNETELTLIGPLLGEQSRMSAWAIVWIVAGFIILVAIAYLLYKKRKKKNTKKTNKRKAKQEKQAKKETFSPDETLDRVITFIRKEKRTTQKEIRKQIGIGEAKVSLIITDLEDRGLVRKIKKGRGNVIIYQGG